MTEAEWNSCTDPSKMLEWLRRSGKDTERRLRLFAVACSRSVWQSLNDESRHRVEQVEQLVDRDWSSARGERIRLLLQLSEEWYAFHDPMKSATRFSDWAVKHAHGAEQRAAEYRRQAELLRDIFGIPSVVFDLAWRAPTVLALAQRAYHERQMPSGILDPRLLAALADALEEAGCDSSEILVHLRSEGPHVRGCWAVDLTLGRS